MFILQAYFTVYLTMQKEWNCICIYVRIISITNFSDQGLWEMERIPTMRILLINLLLTLINYIVITTIIDIILMGMPRLHFSPICRLRQFVITKPNRIDFQNGNECSAFSSAYVLRHWNIEKNGNDLYKEISDKLKDGCVYPKGILKLLSQYGFRTVYYTGNINALKNEVSKGNPVIVLIRTYKDKNWLHFVPVAGYDKQYIYIADSLAELANCDEQYYNRRLAIREFKKLWNTSMLKIPFYRNTYIVARKEQ